MSRFSHKKVPAIKRRKNVVLTVMVLAAIVIVGSATIVRVAYKNNLKPLSSSNIGIAVTIDPGTTPDETAKLLKDKGVIRSDWAMGWYVRNHNLSDQLKAGTYLFHPSQSVPDIVNQLTEGKVATDLVTILPGRTLKEIRSDLVKDGFKPDDVDSALDPAQYASNPALADKPEGASLEGYLYPESFQKTADTSAKQIVKQSLDEMALHLTPEIRAAFNKHGLTVHQGVILASILEQEVNSDSDRAQAAQVFYKRLTMGMPLGSDVTAMYGAVLAGKPASELSYDSPYNTRIHKGLPAGPISNVGDSALKAAAYPADTDWLYFVSGDDGNTYFSKTLQEHEALTQKYCKKLCS